MKTKHRRAPALLACTALALACAASLATGEANYSSGPPASRTGAPAVGTRPAEGNCTICHTAGGEPNLNATGGALSILDLPEFYAPGITYRLRVRLACDRTAADPDRRWGFELTAVAALTGDGAGTFTVRGSGGGSPGDTLQIVDASNPGAWATRQYVQHTFDGVKDGATGPVEWSFDWTAPAQGLGTVLFYAAGNAANGSFEPAGDWIYTTADSMRDTTTAAVPTSWGAIKARWR